MKRLREKNTILGLFLRLESYIAICELRISLEAKGREQTTTAQNQKFREREREREVSG